LINPQGDKITFFDYEFIFVIRLEAVESVRWLLGGKRAGKQASEGWVLCKISRGKSGAGSSCL
jgi:hypothetical protein